MILLAVFCESCGRKIKSKTNKGRAAANSAKAVTPKTILNQYRHLLEHHPEIINGLLLH